MSTKTETANPETDPTLSESTSSTGSHSYVDYIPPPAVKIRPPAKYKLSIIVFILVYFANWFSAQANFNNFLHETVFQRWLDPEATFFIDLGIVVSTLVFSTMDLFIDLFTIKIWGREIGLGPWMKQDRAQWIHYYDNVFFECMACVVQILEDGFAIFDHPVVGPQKPAGAEPREFDCRNPDCVTRLKIEHRINPQKTDQYEEWLKKISKASANARGLVKIDKSKVGTGWDEEEGGGIEKEQEREEMDDVSESSNQPGEGLLHVVYLTFRNIDYLNEWMTSPRRKALMKKLEPILMEPDIVQIQKKRTLPDAFTDLLIQQGSAVPALPPKKWKVAFLTTVALYLSIRWTNNFLPYYYLQWGVHDSGVRVLQIVDVAIVVFVNSYVLTPLLLFAFSYWLIRKECERDTKEPWRTLNDGIKYQWLKALISFAFYGGCLITWLVSEHSTLNK